MKVQQNPTASRGHNGLVEIRAVLTKVKKSVGHVVLNGRTVSSKEALMCIECRTTPKHSRFIRVLFMRLNLHAYPSGITKCPSPCNKGLLKGAFDVLQLDTRTRGERFQ